MKFNIIENPDPGYNIEDVQKDYQNPDITVKEIREKYGITPGAWKNILRHWKNEGVPLRSNCRLTRKPNYYTLDKRYGIWYVQRTVKNRCYRFGGYKTEEEAKARVEELHENNWEGLLK